jgi:uncharacterized phiE125 gp8 family phage protein
MTIVVYAGPATEPLTVAEAMAHCRIDSSNQEPAPGVVTAALASPAVAGSVNNGAHRYLGVFRNADGHTQAGTISAAVTVAANGANGKIELTALPVGGSLMTYLDIYRTAAGGSTYLFLAALTNGTATYTDNIADASLGAEAPATNTTSDPLLGLLIASARAAAETELHRSLVTQTRDMYLDEFPNDWIYGATFDCKGSAILLPPLQSVTSITYVDTNGTTQTLAADQYLVDAKSQPARITPTYGLTWPSTRKQNNAITIRFVDGYGAAAAVPQCIKNWMLVRIKTLWDNREQIVVGPTGMVQIPPSFIDSLLDSERVYGRLFA